MSGLEVKRGYSDGPHGQIHWRTCGSGGGVMPDLYLLHPAPYSGLAFTTIMPKLAERRRVIAPDFPGHGGSDPFRATPEISDYARAVLALIDETSTGGPVDLLGFHTGCLVAAEASLIGADRVRRLVLLNAPAFDPETRAAQLESVAQPPELTPDLECLAPMWELSVTRHIESQGIDRAFDMFAEHLRHGRAMNAAFHAGFSYDVEGRLPQVTRPTTVIASQSGLLDAMRRTAELVSDARLVERLDIKRAVLDEAAAQTATSILEALA